METKQAKKVTFNGTQFYTFLPNSATINTRRGFMDLVFEDVCMEEKMGYIEINLYI